METQAPTKLMSVALVGNPNSGKSSVFNRLTGLNQKVGNFPGVTVDKKTGKFQADPSLKVKVTDLPGAYSLYPTTMDERIVLDVLIDPENQVYPDRIVYVADASNLERHLLLLTQIKDMGFEVILALNMIDVAKDAGISCDTRQLEVLLGIPVIEINGRNGQGIPAMKALLAKDFVGEKKAFFPVPTSIEKVVEGIKDLMGIENNHRALLLAHHYEDLAWLPQEKKVAIEKLCKTHGFNSIRMQVDETMGRYGSLEPILQKTLKKQSTGEATPTDKADRIVTHPILGPIIFFSILFLVFQAIFAWATYPMDLIDAGFSWLGEWTKDTLPASWVTDLLAEGIIPGIGGILIFIPQIAILFGLIAILEELGYMARAVFLFDKLMQKFGLNGRSIVSLISGVACAIPAIMATRTIGNWKERLITIFVTPLMSCSARIPVYVVLVAFVVPEQSFWGIFNLQGLAIFGLYLLGAGSAILSAWAMKLVLKTHEQSYFMMELPVYKMPYWKNVGLTIVEKVKTFVLEAGQVILVISMILWVLASFGPGDKMEEAATAVRQEAKAQGWDEEEIENRIAAQQIEYSYAGYFGHAIEPVIKPLGFDWKIGIALITSFAAREVFVGTMATIYSVGGTEDEDTIRERMRKEVNPETGEMVYTPATSLSLLIYYVFAMQCMSTLAVVYRETKSWKWPFIQLVYMTGLAYLASLLAYNLLV